MRGDLEYEAPRPVLEKAAMQGCSWSGERLGLLTAGESGWMRTTAGVSDEGTARNLSGRCSKYRISEDCPAVGNSGVAIESDGGEFAAYARRSVQLMP
jgi:hypothetical protein